MAVMLIALRSIYASGGLQPTRFDQFPSMIVYVEHPEEVAPLVKCAKDAGIKAVPRSGGHQYVGNKLNER